MMERSKGGTCPQCKPGPQLHSTQIEEERMVHQTHQKQSYTTELLHLHGKLHTQWFALTKQLPIRIVLVYMWELHARKLQSNQNVVHSH